MLLRCREPLVAACIGLSVIWSAEGSRQGLRGAGMSSPRDNDHELPVKRARLCEKDQGRTTVGNAGCRELQGGQGCFMASGDAVNRYESWLRETGAWWDQENVEIRSPWRHYSAAHNVPEYLRDGWGLMSRGKKIKKGTVICKVPKAASFRSDDGRSSSEEQDSQLHLAVRLLREQRKGPASQVWPKIETLPSGVPVCWAWNEEEREWLVGSELELVISRKLKRLREEFRDGVEPLGEGWTEAEYVDACATIISHANPWWGVSSVAFVDMGNHDDDPHVEFRQQGSHVVGTVIKTIPRFSEIYQSYGELGSADLLYRYGFTRGGDDPPHPEDVVSIDMSVLSGCLPGDDDQMDRNGRQLLLQECNVIDQSPWDGLEDVLTVQISLSDEARAPKSTSVDEPWAMVPGGTTWVSGLSELLVGCHVMTMECGSWRRLTAAFESAKKDVRSCTVRALGETDCAMLALFLALQHMHEGEETTLPQTQRASELIARLLGDGVKLFSSSSDDSGGDRSGAEGKAAPKTAECLGGAAADEDEDDADGSVSDGDKDDDNELDWDYLVGGVGAKAQWLHGAHVLAATRKALEIRRAQLHTRALPAESDLAGSQPNKARLLGMAKRIRQLELAVLDAALGATDRLERRDAS